MELTRVTTWEPSTAGLAETLAVASYCLAQDNVPAEWSMGRFKSGEQAFFCSENLRLLGGTPSKAKPNPATCHKPYMVLVFPKTVSETAASNYSGSV